MTDTPSSPRPVVLYGFLFLSGLATMGVELTAVRLLAPHFGTSTIVWTNVICVILVALSLGYWAGGAIADRRPGAGTLSTFAIAGGLVLLVVPAVGPWVATAAVPTAVPVEAAHSSLLATSLVVAAVLFAPAVFLLAATTPLAYKLLLAPDGSRSGRRVGVAAMVSTLGGIAGTYLPTLVLVPTIGSRRTLWSMAAVAVVAGLLARFAARRVAVAAAALAAGFALAAGSPSRADARGSTLEEVESTYQYLAVRDDGAGTITLTANEGRFGFQSAYRPGELLTGGRYFDYFPLFAAAAAPETEPLRVLVLGFAAGTSARQIHALFAAGGRHVAIDGVEIDPAAIELGRRRLGFDLGPDDGVRVFHEDARTFVNRGPGPYDLVIVDVYAHDVYVPFQVASLEFFVGVARALAPEGLLVVNASTFTPEARPLRLLENTIAGAFGRVARYPIELTQNVLLVASPSADRPLDPLASGARGAPIPDGLAPVRKAFRSDRLEVASFDPSLAPLTDDLSPLDSETEALLDRTSRALERAGR